MIDYSEKNFEATIEHVLLSGEPDASPDGAGVAHETSPPYGNFAPSGYRARKPEVYDRALCLDPGTVLDFIYATQPKEWDKLKQQHGAEVKARFLKRLASEIGRRGTLDVLRQGTKDSGCRFQLAYFRPASGLNEALQTLYEANLFTIVRQLKYSEKTEHSLDLVLFLNGLPIF
jgi:type I restriction enzyme, R subunit